MPVDRPRVYADADLFVSVLRKEPGHELALSVLRAAERRDIELVASRLISVEVGGWGGDRPGQVAADQLIDRYLDTVGAEWVEVDVLVARDARRLGWRYGLRAGDAIHLATAVRRNVEYFMAYDKQYPHGETVEGVAVGRPRIVWQPSLLDEF